ncbi:hypothetical protein [Spirosoma luteum]|uniref:hypothetical protein n=1 Tax=Spirosoma luteum TaxID=431553 RepID=UPI0003A17C7C|nr:hypothetical protein [Spirosoma luteum]
MKHQHQDKPVPTTDPAHQNMADAPKATPHQPVEPPAEQKSLQHIGHDGHSGQDNPESHKGGTGMEHSKMDHCKMGHGSNDHGAMIADFLRRFWVCIVLSISVIALSMMFQNLAGYELDLPGMSGSLLVWPASSTFTVAGRF